MPRRFIGAASKTMYDVAEMTRIQHGTAVRSLLPARASSSAIGNDARPAQRRPSVRGRPTASRLQFKMIDGGGQRQRASATIVTCAILLWRRARRIVNN